MPLEGLDFKAFFCKDEKIYEPHVDGILRLRARSILEQHITQQIQQLSRLLPRLLIKKKRYLYFSPELEFVGGRLKPSP